MRHAAILALAVLAAPTLAQEAVSPGALAAFALEACVRDTPDVETVETGEFAPSERRGEAVTFAHPAGPTLTWTVRPGFFACELVVPDATEALHDAMLAEISPAMQKRFDLNEPQGIETGLVWDATTPASYSLTAELSLHEDGTLRFTSATQADEAEPAPAQRDY